MAEKSSFFNAIIQNDIPDRTYKAEEFARFFSSLIGNGVFPNPSTGLQVSSVDSNMTIRVKPGMGWINGYFYDNTDDLILHVSNADGVLNRIDRVVVRLDFLNREIRSYIKKGTFASAPVAPSLQRDADMYEIALADIRVNAGTTNISQSVISDLRLNKDLCGIVKGTVEEIDTTTLLAQLEAWKVEEMGSFKNWKGITLQQFESDFNHWFDTVKGILDGDIAANLANRILELENKINNMKLESTAIDVVDTADNFTADAQGKKLLEDVLVQINTKAKEAFQQADSGKNIITTAIGSPVLATDTFIEMGNKIDELNNTLKTNLSNKGVGVQNLDKMQSLIEKINDIPTYKKTVGSNCVLYNIRYRFEYFIEGNVKEFTYLANRTFNLNNTINSVKIGAMFCCVGSSWSAFIKLVHKRNNKEIGSFVSSNTSMERTGTIVAFYVDNVCNGDIVEIYYKTPSTGSSSRIIELASTGLYCDMEI